LIFIFCLFSPSSFVTFSFFFPFLSSIYFHMYAFVSPPRPDRLWSPPSLLSSGRQGLFPWGWSSQCMKLTTHFDLVTRTWVRGAILPLPITRVLS
jgi:hypothetical protein